jgi:hypothetical protein
MSWPSLVILTSIRDGESLVAKIRSFGVDWSGPPYAELMLWKGYSYSFDFSGDVISDFEPEEIDHVESILGETHAVYVACESMEAARAFLSDALQGVSGLVDTNHGDIVEIGQFLRLIKAHPSWDWRRTTVEELLVQRPI